MRLRQRCAILTATLMTIGLRAATADQIVPIVGHVNGLHGSVFRSDLKLYNPTSKTIKGHLVFTERGQSMSDLSGLATGSQAPPPSDPVIPYELLPGETRVLIDVYAIAKPGTEGAARVFVRPSREQPVPFSIDADPVVDSSTYNALPDGGELGMSPTPFKAADFYVAGTTLSGITGKQGERTNPFILTGPGGATITFTLKNPGATPVAVSQAYGPDAVFQYAPVGSLMGVDAAPNAVLEARIDAGSARLAASPVNNVSGQGRWIDFNATRQAVNTTAAQAYVTQHLPRDVVWLNNDETRAMFLGTTRTRSYARDIALAILSGYPGAFCPGTFCEKEVSSLAISYQATAMSYVYVNHLDFLHDKDPLIWSSTGLATYNQPPTTLPVLTWQFQGPTQAPQMYASIKESLADYVANYPEHYGGKYTSIADMSLNPTWNSQDPN